MHVEIDSDNFSAFVRKYMGDKLRDIETRANRAVNAASKKYTDQYVEDIKELFRETVSDFYHSYEPEIYSRRENLYKIFQTSVEEDDEGRPVVVMEFQPDNMTKSRKGGFDGEHGLYDLVFRKGYHGGAYHEGKPYWRTGYGYSRWGRPAKKASTPPLVAFRDIKKARYETGNQARFDRIFAEELRKEGFDVEI